MAKSVRTIIQLGALVMLLIVFPAASWYYLNSGLQYRRSTMAELKEYGTFPDKSWTLVDGTLLSEQFLDKKMLLAHVMPDGAKKELVTRYGEILHRLHDQFEEREELVFLSLLHGDSKRSAQQVRQFARDFKLDDQKLQFFIQLEEATFESLSDDILQPKMESPVTEPSAFFLLTDTTATIRRYYDVREDADVKRLVEHIALLLPFDKGADIIFEREAEK